MTPFFERDGITIYHGEALAVLEQLPRGAVGMLLTDPPYSSGGLYRGDRGQRPSVKYCNSNTTAKPPDFTGDNRDQRSFAFWCALWLSAARLAAADGALFAMFSDWRQLPTATDAVQAGGWLWRGVVVWDNGEGVRPYRGGFRAQSEYVVWGSNGPLDVPDSSPCLPGVFRVPIVPGAKRDHIAQKPEPLIFEILRAHNPTGLVLDPFIGSGTTLVAAHALGLRAIGVDLDAANCEIAARRLSQRKLDFTAE